MNDVGKLLVCALASLLLHWGIAEALRFQLPELEILPTSVVIKVVEPPRKAVEPPPPPPEPEPPKPPVPLPPPKVTPKVVHEAPTKAPVKAKATASVAHDTPPVDHAPTTTDTTDEPVFGATMESTSTGGHGPALPVGNTTRVAPGTGAGSAQVKPLAAPVAAFAATKMPMPQGRCFGVYNEEAKAAGVEGVVVLDLTVGEDGRTRDIKVVSGLSHGLTEAAVAAATSCRFSPGEKDGVAVPVRVRGFKIRFVIEGND
jgi:protein TonB